MRRVASVIAAWLFVMPAALAVAPMGPAVAQGYHPHKLEDYPSWRLSELRDYSELSSGQLGKIIAKYRALTEPYRQNALEVAAQARGHSLPAGMGINIREALEADMTLWYNSMPVSKGEWDSMRAQWLVPVASLNDPQWAQQRAAWFTARDAWLDKRMRTAQPARH
jgi:hypothetical protein